MTHARNIRSQRSGFTLRELSIAIAVGSTVMMTAVGMLNHSFRWSTLAQHRRTDDQTFFNLSRQLRADLHIAREAAVRNPVRNAVKTEVESELKNAAEPTGGLLTLTTDSGNVVTYTINERSVTRLETRQDETVGQDNYRWKRPRTLRFDRLETDDQIQLNAKSVTPHAESEVPLWRSLRVSVGLRLRHQQGDIAS